MYPPILFSHLVPYGTVRRTHGHKGSVVIQVHSEELFALEPQFLFVEYDGTYIPFGVEEMRGTKEQLITTLQFIETEEEAMRYRGASLFVHTRELEGLPLSTSSASPLSVLGKEVYHTSGILIGTLQRIDDTTANVVLVISSPSGDEVLIPYVEEWIVNDKKLDEGWVLDCPIELTQPLN